MEKYFKKTSQSCHSCASTPTVDLEKNEDEQRNKRNRTIGESSKSTLTDIDNLQSDPGLRIPISEFSFNIRDQIRRSYLQKGPCQPRNHDCPKSKFGMKDRRFNPRWFDKYSSWLEYSIQKDKAYCLYCYLFGVEGRGKEDDEAFRRNGFSNWKKPDRFDLHIGGPNSAHNNARQNCEDLMKQDQNIHFAFHVQSDRTTNAYRIRLNSSIDCVKFLLRQGLAFRGHDESFNSKNQGNFLELLQF
ncbi:hypothetical protein MA16_Dca013174 [Dendrobium catenatum]|uniref:TTF-type domain-containing protein n=1 Tax=Dendrobium catenatum TaxID=906689 RepID=A0A2I0WR17_9ASPA|nr:hypothetical protein MA16_Dca013174 [Dendrobium catenatum]